MSFWLYNYSANTVLCWLYNYPANTVLFAPSAPKVRRQLVLEIALALALALSLFPFLSFCHICMYIRYVYNQFCVPSNLRPRTLTLLLCHDLFFLLCFSFSLPRALTCAFFPHFTFSLSAGSVFQCVRLSLCFWSLSTLSVSLYPRPVSSFRSLWLQPSPLGYLISQLRIYLGGMRTSFPLFSFRFQAPPLVFGQFRVDTPIFPQVSDKPCCRRFLIVDSLSPRHIVK